MNLPKYVLCRPRKTAEAAFQSFLFIPKILFTTVLLMQNCKRTEDQTISAKPFFTVRRGRQTKLNHSKPSFSRPPRHVLQKELCSFCRAVLFFSRSERINLIAAQRTQVYGSATNGFLKFFHTAAPSYSLTEPEGTFNVTPDKATPSKALPPSVGGVTALQVTLCNFVQLPQK